jgi:hypothetical protein
VGCKALKELKEGFKASRRSSMNSSCHIEAKQSMSAASKACQQLPRTERRYYKALSY